MVFRFRLREFRKALVMEKKESSPASNLKRKGQQIIRALWLTAGTICVALGAIGIVLPILPTTPFLLAAAACYYKSSPRLHRWLLNNKYFGEYIRNYTEGKGLTAKTKVTALTVLWATISISIVFALPRLLPITFVLPLQIIMIAMAAAVSVHILRLPTYRKA